MDMFTETYTNPFNVTGVDFTGALYVRFTEGEQSLLMSIHLCCMPSSTSGVGQ